MANEIVKVRVRFALIPRHGEFGGDVIAIIRDVWDKKAGKWVKDVRDRGPYKMVTTYMHVGQHSDAAWDWAQSLRPASPKEFHPLLNELTSIGYDVTVLNRAWYHTNKKGVLS